MKKTILTYIAALVLIVWSCEDPYKNSTFAAFEEVPGATYLESHPEKYRLWVEMINRAGLFRTLNLNEVYTFFVPNNEAVEAYLSENGYTSVEDVEPADAAYLVRYHLLADIEFDQSRFENGAIPKATETDDDLTIEFRDGGLNSIYLNGEARFVELDIEVTNGVIHEIDKVLIPITASVNEMLDAANYSIFHDALEATGYSDVLDVIYQVDTTNGVISERRFQFTVFAVTNDVFAQEGIGSLADLNVALGTTGGDYEDEENELNKYVAYHVLSSLRSTASLSDFPEGENSTNINTSAPNEVMSLSNVAGTLYINYNEEEGTGIQIVDGNIAARNGVIHQVDNWMPLFTPSQVTVIWDLADQSDIASLATSFQRSDLTGSYYQRSFTEDELTSYNWRSSPQGRDNVVVYRNNRSNDGVYYFTMNYDHMRFTTGASGWVETNTPVLIRGSYRIVLGYVSPLSTSNSGIMIASMDGRQLGSQLITSNTSQDQLREHVLAESFEFTETSSHTFRIVGVDGRLLTLDYLRFEPVE